MISFSMWKVLEEGLLNLQERIAYELKDMNARVNAVHVRLIVCNEVNGYVLEAPHWSSTRDCPVPSSKGFFASGMAINSPRKRKAALCKISKRVFRMYAKNTAIVQMSMQHSYMDDVFGVYITTEYSCVCRMKDGKFVQNCTAGSSTLSYVAA